MSNLREIRPIIKVITKAILAETIVISKLLKSDKPSIRAPIDTGINNENEYLKANAGLKPNIKEATIVEAEREIPGSMARA